MPLTLELLKHYPNQVFIETGSYKGDGIALALEAGFDKILSVELEDHWFNHVTSRFYEEARVEIHSGNSEEFLLDQMEWINPDRITFWLDAHYMGEGSARGAEESPLLGELHGISKSLRNDHTIIIDDLRTFSREANGFDRQDLVNILKVINPSYRFRFWDNALPSGHVVERDILVAVI